MKNHEKRKISVGLLIALVGFPQISETIYTPALPSIVDGLNASAYMVEATLAIYFFGFAFGVLSWGAISDFFGRRCVMLVGLLAYGIATLACANVGSVEALLIWRFFQAFGASVGSVITQTILRDAYDVTERTKLFSIISGALAFSPAIGPLLGGVISEFFGWRTNFWTLAILALTLFFWTFFSLQETRPRQFTRLTINKIGELVSSMMSSRQLLGHIFLIAGTNGILFGFYQEAPFIFIEQLGMQPKIYGLFGLLIAAATILAARISYRQSSFFSHHTIILWGATCILVGGLMLTLTVVVGIFYLSIGIVVAVLTLFLIFFGIGLIIPNSLSHALKPYQNAVGTAGSIFGCCYYYLIAGCMWLMSALHNGSALPLPIFIILLGLIIVLGAYMTYQIQSANQNMKS